jgi:hypothetical protein
MTHKILWAALWALPLCLRAQTAGVGINTENLQGVVHVDAAANNPSSGNIPAAQQADDVVITQEGHAGAGTINPSTQLHIHTQGQTGVFPLRIAKGSPDNNNRMLTSDDDGVASWQTPPLPPSSDVYPITTVRKNFSFPLGQETEAIDTQFTVPEDGFYSADVRFWGEWCFNCNTLTLTVTRFQLRKNGTTVADEFLYHEPSYTRLTVFFTLYTPAVQGDVLSLYVYPVTGANGLTADPTTTSADYAWIKTRVLYKKLGVNDNTHYFD